MQVALCVVRERLPEVFDQFAIEITQFRRGHRCIEDQVTASTEVDC